MTIFTLPWSTPRAVQDKVEWRSIQNGSPMRLPHHAASLIVAAAIAAPTAMAAAAEVVPVTAANMHLDRLQPATLSYLVYFHGAPDSGIKRPMLATSRVTREQVDGADAWVIAQHWEDDSGVVHTARTVHAADDIATLSQVSSWTRPAGSITTTVVPAEARGTVEGEVPPEARERMEAGFATMDDGWWFNWQSDLVLLPLLPYELGGTLRVHLFDVGLPAPLDVDYTVVGERTLVGGDGRAHACWLVETESGRPGSGNYQRFWIDQASRVVLKEEDIFNGQYRSKVLLSVPATTEFALAPGKEKKDGQAAAQ